jgi:hemolysin activation/secretion protein
VQTAIANENPNKLIQVGLREGDQPDQIEATINVKEDKPWTIAASLSNAGTASSGRDRFTISGAHSNLFNRDHQFVGAYTTSLQKASDVKQVGLSYKVPLYEQGMVLGASYTRSDVVGDFGSFTSTGAGHTLGLTATKYLAPEGGRRSYFTVGFDDKVFDATLINGLVVPGTLPRRSRPLWVGFNARTESDTSVWGYDATISANTASGANNDLASYQSEDLRIDTVHWKVLRGGINYSAPLANSWLWSARANFQYSPDVLISGEQFGLGGLGSVRGTSVDRPITGDFGLQGTLEVITPELAPGLKMLGFFDVGWLGNNSAAPAAGKFSSDGISSIGLGLRYSAGPFGLSADYGRLISGSKVPLTLNSAAPKRGDDRFYVNLSVKF